MALKYSLVMVAMILTISVVCASNPSFGIFEQNECVELKQICFINGSQCDVCNLTSIDYPDGRIAVNNTQMQKREGDFNYTFCDSTYNGRYDVNGYCTYGSDVKKPFTAFFEVTPNGELPTSSKALFYIGAMVILLLMFFMTIAGLIRFERPSWKLLFGGLSYLMLIAISYTAWVISINFITATAFIGNFFYWIFIILLIAFVPLFLGAIAWYIWLLMSIKQINNMIERGIPGDEAYENSIRGFKI